MIKACPFFDYETTKEPAEDTPGNVCTCVRPVGASGESHRGITVLVNSAVPRLHGRKLGSQMTHILL